jgi:DNA-binding NtrC family response regulator
VLLRTIREEARKRKPGIKVIFTSGYPLDMIRKEGVFDNDIQFISKPASPQTLLQKVRETLDRGSGDGMVV